VLHRCALLCRLSHRTLTPPLRAHAAASWRLSSRGARGARVRMAVVSVVCTSCVRCDAAAFIGAVVCVLRLRARQLRTHARHRSLARRWWLVRSRGAVAGGAAVLTSSAAMRCACSIAVPFFADSSDSHAATSRCVVARVLASRAADPHAAHHRFAHAPAAMDACVRVRPIAAHRCSSPPVVDARFACVSAVSAVTVWRAHCLCAPPSSWRWCRWCALRVCAAMLLPSSVRWCACSASVLVNCALTHAIARSRGGGGWCAHAVLSPAVRRC
jgi:hypothetical protein